MIELRRATTTAEGVYWSNRVEKTDHADFLVGEIELMQKALNTELFDIDLREFYEWCTGEGHWDTGGKFLQMDHKEILKKYESRRRRPYK